MDRNGLNSIACEIHAQAVEKGFWDVEDAMAKHIAKMHSELSEALQEDRMGHPMLYVDDIDALDRITDPALFDGRKPEGVAAELADFLMMALDYAEEIGLNIAEINLCGCDGLINDYGREPLYKFVVCMHGYLMYAFNGTDKNYIAQTIALMIASVKRWLEQRGVDLWQVVRLKLEYNKSRPALHGRKY